MNREIDLEFMSPERRYDMPRATMSELWWQDQKNSRRYSLGLRSDMCDLCGQEHKREDHPE